ncbi:MAG: membrane protease subunit HflK, partial [Oleispira sp.]
MAWNEPGGGKDPWGNGGSGANNGGNRGGNNGGNNQGPPDLDEALKQLMDKLSNMFGGKGGGNDKKGSSQNTGGIIGILAIVGVLFLGFSAVYTLDEKERGVILLLGKYDRTEGPGLQFKWPLIESLTRIETTTVRK